MMLETLVPMAIILAWLVGGMYALWIFYLAVMNLSRAKRTGLLSPTARTLGLPILIIGYVLDFLTNLTVMTLVLLELPRETTVTARLKRHHRESTGWRLKVVLWFEPILDPYDPSGDHI
jgi:hypothetical protein